MCGPRLPVEGTEAIFFIFHFLGSIGVSQAQCESINSHLKYYASIHGLSFPRVRQKTMLKSFGLTGMTNDDVFITRVWSQFFGASAAFKFFTKNENRRKKKFPLGKGSKTVHGVVAKTMLKPMIRSRTGTMARKLVANQWAKPRQRRKGQPVA